MMHDAASTEAATGTGFGKRGSVFGSRNHDGLGLGEALFPFPERRGFFSPETAASRAGAGGSHSTTTPLTFSHSAQDETDGSAGVPEGPASARSEQDRSPHLPRSREESMVTHVDIDVPQLWRDYRANPNSVELRNQLVELYLPLVKYNAERIWARLPDGVDLDDLISAGVFGLMDAIEAFDLERGVKFETYCVPRIRGAMLDELRTMDWVPRLVRSKATRLEEARKSLEAQIGRPPRSDEMAAKLGVSLAEFD